MSAILRVGVVGALGLSVLLTGCAGTGSPASSVAEPGVMLRGTVIGGQQPVSGAHVYLYAASSSGYGAASSSLLSTTGANVTVDASGHAYVTTGSTGGFTITADYTCPAANPQVYLVAVQGNPGLVAGTNNTALALMAAIGPCLSLTAATQIGITEVSTAAAATVLQQFMTDEYDLGASSTNTTGLANSFTSVINLVDLASGSGRATNLLGNGINPQTKLNTLGNILAPCINSAGPTSSACVSLFAAATPSGGTAPTDTAKAALAIAKNPGSNVAALFGQINAAAPFQPTLSAAPNDYTLAVTFTGGGLTSPGDVVIDAAGDAFTANCPVCNSLAGTDSIVGFGPQGAVLTGTAGFSASIHKPEGLALDASGNIWSVDDASGSSADSVVKMTSAGALVTGFPYTSTANLAMPVGIAIDAGSNAWVTNEMARPGTTPNVVELNASGTLVTSVSSTSLLGSAGVGIDPNTNVFVASTGSSDIFKIHPSPLATTAYTSATLSTPISIAIDNANNIWTINDQANTLSVLNGTTGAAVTSSVGAGFAQAAVIAIDGAGTGWVANCRVSCPGSGSASADNLLHFGIGGGSLTVSDGFQDSHLSSAGVAAIDGSGNVWVSNNTGGSLTEFLGVAAPVKTPLVTAVANSQLGVRP